MKLITETLHDINNEEILNEKTGIKERFITGVFLQADIQNKNGRIYPLPILNTEVARFNKEMVNENRALGELGHPNGPMINLDRVSHQITELKLMGTNFVGKAKILDTPMGKIAESFLKADVKIGVSSRGMGSVNHRNGKDVVQDDFRLATIDIVSDPSAPAAFVKGIMENCEWVLIDGIYKEEKFEEVKKAVKKAPRSKLEETYVQLFQDLVAKF